MSSATIVQPIRGFREGQVDNAQQRLLLAVPLQAPQAVKVELPVGGSTVLHDAQSVAHLGFAIQRPCVSGEFPHEFFQEILDVHPPAGQGLVAEEREHSIALGDPPVLGDQFGGRLGRKRAFPVLARQPAYQARVKSRDAHRVIEACADIADPHFYRRVNQFVSWSIVKGAIEHSEALLLFDRFPHRNVVLQRPHRGGEPRYLTDAMRPLWSFTQVPDPDYFAVLGALYRTGNGLDENRIARDNLAALLRAAGVSPDDPTAPMDIFDLVGDDVVPYPPLYRHLRLPEHAGTLDILRRMPLVIELTNAVKSLILKDGDLTWPPRSVKHSLETAINVAGLNALVRGGRRSGSTAGKIADGSGRRGGDGCEPPSELTLSLTVRNDGRELERVSAAVDGFADRHRFPQQDRFQVQLCIEEILVYIVEHGYDDAGTHRIEVQIEMSDEDRRLEIRTVDDGRELAPGSFMFQPGPDTIQEESVVDGLGFHLVRTYVDELKYRHENGRNYLSLTKRIGS